MLKSEGLVINRKRTYRLYTDLSMQVRTKHRKKLIRSRVPTPVPSCSNERWSLDIVHDQLGNSRRIRVLNIVDDYYRACVGQLVDLSISGERISRYLEGISATGPLPKPLVVDNGPEVTSKAMFVWGRQRGVKLHSSSLGNRRRTRSWGASTDASATVA